MATKKGFTLIELLVVIAIIAILAAILFPVFENARDKARQITDLSNMKQIALSMIMYSGDYDDTFPIGEVPSTNPATNPTGSPVPSGLSFSVPETTNWFTEIAPYASSVPLFYGPDDTEASDPSNSGYFGIKTSFGVNGLDGYNLNIYNVTSAANTPIYRLGVFAPSTYIWLDPRYNGSAYANSVVCKLAEMTKPTETVLLADLQSVDLDKVLTTANIEDSDSYIEANAGNASAFAAPSLIGNLMSGLWGGTGSYNNLQMGASYNSYCQNLSGDMPYNSYTGGGAWEIPNPNRPSTNIYPLGPNGIVSAPFVNKTITNFAFADGHAKSKKPSATNPDGYIGTYGVINGVYQSNNPILDGNNEWIVNR